MTEKRVEVVKSCNLEDGEVDSNKMRDALTSIAQEMNRFQSTTTMNNENITTQESIFQKLKTCKSNLKLKRKQIKRLRDNLRTACIIARTIISTKDSETTSLCNRINFARSECAVLFQKNRKVSETNEKLAKENQALNNKLRHFQNLIELGYEQLQSMRDEPTQNIPYELKLREIMMNCGQYYADYYNERERCAQLERKNTFLDNKLSILETNLEVTRDELENHQYQNVRLKKENAYLRNKAAKLETASLKDLNFSTEYHVQHNSSTSSKKLSTIPLLETRNVDLTSHLSLVQSLLNDQDSMLKDLKNLSRELMLDPISQESYFSD